MKEDVIAANLANLRQSISELKECIEKQNVTVSKSEQSVKVDFDEKTIYNGHCQKLLYLLERSLVCGKETYLETTTRHIAFFAMDFRNSLNYSSRSLNFLNTSIGMFVITISIA